MEKRERGSGAVSVLPMHAMCARCVLTMTDGPHSWLSMRAHVAVPTCLSSCIEGKAARAERTRGDISPRSGGAETPANIGMA